MREKSRPRWGGGKGRREEGTATEKVCMYVLRAKYYSPLSLVQLGFITGRVKQSTWHEAITGELFVTVVSNRSPRRGAVFLPFELISQPTGSCAAMFKVGFCTRGKSRLYSVLCTCTVYCRYGTLPPCSASHAA